MTCYQPAVDKALGKFVKHGHTKSEAEWLLNRHGEQLLAPKESSDDPNEPENTEDEEIGTRDTSRSTANPSDRVRQAEAEQAQSAEEAMNNAKFSCCPCMS